jgi:2,3-bisphosphoglycerate-dependent phosphoglycerate mutase
VQVGWIDPAGIGPSPSARNHRSLRRKEHIPNPERAALGGSIPQREAPSWVSFGTMPITTAYLIRHAQSRPSEQVRYSDWPLSELGRQQADRLTGLLLSLGIERLVSSPFTRCLQTVQPFVRRVGLQVVVCDDLRERHFGIGPNDDFGAIWRKSWEDFSFALPGFESSRDAQRRFVDAMTRILRQHEGRTIGICAHGNVIGLYLNHLDGRNGRETAERLMNPDVLRIRTHDSTVEWDRTFQLPGLEALATDHADTPIATQ